MANRTAVPGAVDIQSPRERLHALLRPEWRPLLDKASAESGLTYIECLRRAVALFPEAGQAEALRMWIASCLAGDFMDPGDRLACQLTGLQIPLPPYILPE